MSYTKTNWGVGDTPINDTNLNKIENKVESNRNRVITVDTNVSITKTYIEKRSWSANATTRTITHNLDTLDPTVYMHIENNLRNYTGFELDDREGGGSDTSIDRKSWRSFKVLNSNEIEIEVDPVSFNRYYRVQVLK